MNTIGQYVAVKDAARLACMKKTLSETGEFTEAQISLVLKAYVEAIKTVTGDSQILCQNTGIDAVLAEHMLQTMPIAPDQLAL